MKQPAKQFSFILQKKEIISSDLHTFTFTTDTAFVFVPGQYLQITVPHPTVDERGRSRFFTISSSPTENGVKITTERGESSFKNALFGLSQGDRVQAFGPMGTFVLEEEINI